MMNINKLEVGMVINNYKELCEVLGINITSGDSKQAQIKELKRVVDYDKFGQKFIIKEIFNEPKDKIDRRQEGNSRNYKDYPNLHISKNEWSKIGVYCIIRDNDIYIGSTVTGFRKRFTEHLRNNNLLPTLEMLNNGGVFHILWVSDVEDEFIVRYMESYFINYYKFRTDYNVVNVKNPNKYEKSFKANYKTICIKIEEEYYDDVLQRLKDLGLK